MQTCWKFCLRLFLVSSALIGISHCDASESFPQIHGFLKQHCYRCHGAAKQENELRFDTLPADLSTHDELETWQAIVDQLNLGAMPPEEEPQPEEAQVAKTIDLLSAQLTLANVQRKSTGAKAVMRRLNRYELRNTLRDLLYLDGDADFAPLLVTKLEDRNGNGRTEWISDDPTREFPADDLEEGFDKHRQPSGDVRLPAEPVDRCRRIQPVRRYALRGTAAGAATAAVLQSYSHRGSRQFPAKALARTGPWF